MKKRMKLSGLLMLFLLCLGVVLFAAGNSRAWAATKPKTPFLKSVSSPGDRRLRANWKKVSDVSGYYVEFSWTYNHDKMTRTTKIEDPDRLYFIGTGFTTGKTYYVRVRAYVKRNGKKYYSDWSNKGKAKITRGKNAVSLSSTTKSVPVGSSFTLKASVTGTNKSVSWKSNNTSVATVASGKVSAKGKGSCIITAKANGSEAYCKVTAKIVPVESVTMNKSQMTVTVGKSGQLTATVTPSDATNKKVTWKSSNTAVATVSGGTVTAKAAGTATITARSNNGKTASCKVTVKKLVVAVTAISLNKTSLILEVGDSYTLENRVSPENATNKSVTWTSSDPSTAVVSEGCITAIAKGTATITARSNNGITASCKVTSVSGSVKMVSCGEDHSAILKMDGSLWMTGYNKYGQLGDGTRADKSQPEEIMEGVQSVSCGGWHTAILKTDGSLWMTGYNKFGQLGLKDGTTVDQTAPVQVMEDVQAVACGGSHTAILKTDGSLWMTGNNDYGQLGDGTKADKSSPVQIMEGVQSVSCGRHYTAILKTDGSLWMTGENVRGQLGDRTKENKDTPVKVMDGVQSVSCGGWHTAIVKTDGSLWATGYNGCGQLGDGTKVDKSAPVQIEKDVQSVACGSSHTAFIKTDGSLWVIGYNNHGQLGIVDGSEGAYSSPVQIMEGIPSVQSVNCGYYYTVIVMPRGSMWMTGKNAYGQFGDGTTTGKKIPVMIPTDN